MSSINERQRDDTFPCAGSVFSLGMIANYEPTGKIFKNPYLTIKRSDFTKQKCFGKLLIQRTMISRNKKALAVFLNE